MLQTSDNYQIDEKRTDIFAQDFLSAGPFIQARIESQGNMVGEEAELIAELELKSSLPRDSKFYINLPNSVFYLSESGRSPECSLNNSAMTLCNDLVIE